MVDEIVCQRWRGCDAYPYRLDGIDFDVWFMNDKLDSRIRYDQNATFKMATFYYETLGDGIFTFIGTE